MENNNIKCRVRYCERKVEVIKTKWPKLQGKNKYCSHHSLELSIVVAVAWMVEQ